MLRMTKVTELLYVTLGTFGALSFNLHSQLWKTVLLLTSPSETNCKWKTKIIPTAGGQKLSIRV